MGDSQCQAAKQRAANFSIKIRYAAYRASTPWVRWKSAVHGVDLGRDWALVGTGLNLPLASSANLFVAYDAQFNAYQAFHVGSGGVELAW